jgi:antitoxin CptB
MDDDTRLKRIRFRAWHRGTREADYLFGGYFDAHHATWGEAELAWFEALIDEQDVDVIGWAMGTFPCPAEWDGPMMTRMRALDYVKIV